MLEKGAYDKSGHDLSDVYRGRIQILKELIDLKVALENQKKSQDANVPMPDSMLLTNTSADRGIS